MRSHCSNRRNSTTTQSERLGYCSVRNKNSKHLIIRNIWRTIVQKLQGSWESRFEGQKEFHCVPSTVFFNSYFRCISHRQSSLLDVVLRKIQKLHFAVLLKNQRLHQSEGRQVAILSIKPGLHIAVTIAEHVCDDALKGI